MTSCFNYCDLYDMTDFKSFLQPIYSLVFQFMDFKINVIFM